MTTTRPSKQIADLFSVPPNPVYGHLNDASKPKRPTIHQTDEPRRASAGEDIPRPATGLRNGK